MNFGALIEREEQVQLLYVSINVTTNELRTLLLLIQKFIPVCEHFSTNACLHCKYLLQNNLRMIAIQPVTANKYRERKINLNLLKSEKLLFIYARVVLIITWNSKLNCISRIDITYSIDSYLKQYVQNRRSMFTIL